MRGDGETFVLRPGPLRIALLVVAMIFCAAIFLFMAAVAVMIDVRNIAGRLALWLLALMLTALAIYVLLLLLTITVRIEVGPQRLKLRMPHTRGPLPVPGTIRADIPYGDIASVETREEVYNSFGLVTLQRSFSIVTRDGARLPLGVMAENWGMQMRFDDAAERIAARAGMSVADRGTVHVGGVLRALIHDVPPWSTEPMKPPESQAWHRRGALTVQFLMLLLAAIAVLRLCSKS